MAKRDRGAAKKRGQPEGASALLARKKDQLDWQQFHFLENLLVFCAQASRSAPQESGVKFHISPAVQRDGVCLLFKIDRGGQDPLMPNDGLKPDYLVLHLSPQEGCLCTIVEMKGKDEKKIEHAVEQVLSLRERLREEMREHLPGSWQGAIHVQGLILAPPNVQVPFKKIESARRGGLTIAVLTYSKSFELYDFVRRKIGFGRERYPGQEPNPPAAPHEIQSPLNVAEKMLASGSLPGRLPPPLFLDQATAPPRHEGVRIDLATPEQSNNQWLRLSLTKKRGILGFHHDSLDLFCRVLRCLHGKQLARWEIPDEPAVGWYGWRL